MFLNICNISLEKVTLFLDEINKITAFVSLFLLNGKNVFGWQLHFLSTKMFICIMSIFLSNLPDVILISLLSMLQISNMALRINKSLEQWASLGDLSLVTCLPKPWTCGPEGASLSVWMKIEDCSENGTDGYISSMSWGSNGFQVRCHHGKLRYRCVSPFTAPKGSFSLRIPFCIKLVNVENVAITYL